ncbi:MAG TPA: GNAT family N-acetyltransferase [Solirubrobacteraceae bacterium]|nr:GNAT family N-acetyltransferase [Solirubrobacteraceae bacterium]
MRATDHEDGPASTASASRTYPADREADVVLRDGTTAHVRPVRPDDGPSIHAFLEAVSPESIGFRFFGTPNINWATAWAVDVDYADRFGLVVESGSPHAIVAHAVYIRLDATRAEVAFLVTDAWQGEGIATILLAHLAEVAEQHGIATFVAEVLPTNHRMVEVFRESGFPVDVRSRPDVLEIELPTSLSPAAIERFEERGRSAAVAAVRSVLEPRSVAVIGASRRRGTIGGEILHNVIAGGFTGAVYAVNPNAEQVQSLPAYHSIADVPERVQLAVVAVPAEGVVAVARECAAAGVHALLVISAGFAESGPEGARRQQELVDVCRDTGIRIVGPNCLGVLNTALDVRLNATFAPPATVPGNVGFMSQSGGLGIAIIEAARRLGVGLSSFASVGNKADLSGNDFLQYWEQDPGTDLVMLYIESFGNPRRFSRVARRIAAHKPILAVKSGRSAAGARATSSHTGALLSVSDVTVGALFEQAGVIRTDTMHQLFDVAALLSAQPVPRGDRVAIVTNGGGPGILCVDALQANGVDVAGLTADVRERLAEFLPSSAALGNPVDVISSASADVYERTLRTLIDTDACDAIIAIFVPPLVTQVGDVALSIRHVAESNPDVTIAAVMMVDEGTPPELQSETARVPCYEFPEAAARAMALAIRHRRWRDRDPGRVPDFPAARRVEAAAIISRELAVGSEWLSPARVAQLLDCYSLPLIQTRVVSNGAEAVSAAAELGTAVALKASAEGLLHKTDAGGVRLGLRGAWAVRAAAAAIAEAMERAGLTLDGFVVQPMAPDGVELIVGVVNDHSFGPVLACGAGGTSAELMQDVAVRITPVTDVDAHEMVRSLRTFPLLDGYRGARPCNVAAVEDVLLRVSAMVDAHPEIVELDCNPLIVTFDQVLIVDARVRVETAEPPAPMPSLRA